MKDLKTLTVEVEIIAGAIKRDSGWIILRREGQTTQVFLNIIQLVNYVELIYRNILQIRTGKHVLQRDLVNGILELKIDQDFLKAYSKVKKLRNAIVHSINLGQALHNYFTKEKGIGRAVKLNSRIDVLINNIKADIKIPA